MHAPYISTNNKHARLLIILDNIRSHYGLDTPNNYPATLYTKGRLPTLSLECPSDSRFPVHLRSRCIRSCAVFPAQLDSALLLFSTAFQLLITHRAALHRILSSISISNCAPQHVQLCTVSLDFLLVPCYSFSFLPCASQHSAAQRSL